MKKNRWFIIAFLLLLTVPVLFWGVHGLFHPDELAAQVREENRSLARIEWGELLRSCQSVNSWYNDRAPYRRDLIRLYQDVNGRGEGWFDDKIVPALDKIFFASGKTKPAQTPSVPGATLPHIGFDPAAVNTQPSQDPTEAPGEEDPGDCSRGHDKELVGKAEASYTSWGYTDYRCRRCGLLLREDVVPKLRDESSLSPKTVGEGTILGRGDWLFYTGNNTVSYYKGTNLLSDEAMDEYVTAIRKLKARCDELGIRLAVMIIPCKEQVYDEYMPSYTVETNYKRSARLADRIRAFTGVPVLYPLRELKEGDLYHETYYRYDTHWNYYGAFIGTMSLYGALGLETRPALDINLPGTEESVSWGDLIQIGGLGGRDFPAVAAFKPADYHDSEITWEQSDADGMVYRSESTGPIDHRLVFIGDSFRTFMQPYLAHTFQKTLIMHRDYLGPSYKERLQTCGTLVLEAGERYDSSLLDAASIVLSLLYD